MKNTLFIFTALLFGITACKKIGCTDPLATNYNDKAIKDDGSCTYLADSLDTIPQVVSPEPILPAFAGEYGALIGIKTLTTTQTPIGPFETEFGTGVAVFSQDGGTSYQTAGTITVATNGSTKTLTANSNNTYVYTPSGADLSGIAFSGNVTWSGTGATWPSFSATTSQGFADVMSITSGDIVLSNSYSLTCGGISNADSVYFAVYGSSGSKVILKAGNASSHTFSNSDLSGLGAGSGFVQITAIKYDSQTINGKPYYLINETVRTKQVNLN